jgi:hypothetical protein
MRGVVEQRGDFSFARLVQAAKAHLQLLGLVLVENLQPDDLIGLPVAHRLKAAHGAGDGLAQDFVAFGDVDSAPLDQRFEEAADAHKNAAMRE